MNKIKSLKINHIFYVLLFAITVIRIYAGHFFITGQSILSWPSVSYIPLIESINFNGTIVDSFTQNAIDSPNIIFAYFINFFSYLGLDAFETLLLFKLIYIFFIPILIMSLCFLFCERLSYVHKYSKDIILFQKILIFIGILFLSNFFYIQLVLLKILNLLGFYEFNLNSLFMPFGWDDPMSHQFIAPSTLAFFTGVIFNILCMKDTKKNNVFAYLILFTTTLVHPVVGIGNFIVAIILSCTLLISRHSILNFLKYFIVGIALPIVFLLINFEGNNDIDLNNFVNIYVYLRHPHHYLMSETLGLGSIFWFSILLLNSIYAFKAKSKHLIILNSFTTAFILFSVLAQFMGSEIFLSRRIIELGPSRFSQYIFMLCLIGFISNAAFFAQKKNLSVSHFFQKIYLTNYSQVYYSLFYLFIFLTSFIYFNATQFDDFNRKDKELTDWINAETSPGSIFFVPEHDNNIGSYPLSFLIRIFSNRPVWVDHAYPFNHNASHEWGKKYKIYKDFNVNDLPENIVCSDLLNFDYIVLSASNDDLKNNYIFGNATWRVYDSYALKSKGCL